MGLSTALRKVVSPVVKAVDGTACTIKRKGSYDPDTATVGADTSYTTTVAFDEYPSHLVDGERIRGGDIRGYVPASGLSITPTPGKDRLVVGSESWQIVRVKTYRPGTTDIAYELQLRN